MKYSGSLSSSDLGTGHVSSGVVWSDVIWMSWRTSSTSGQLSTGRIAGSTGQGSSLPLRLPNDGPMVFFYDEANTLLRFKYFSYICVQTRIHTRNMHFYIHNIRLDIHFCCTVLVVVYTVPCKSIHLPWITYVLRMYPTMYLSTNIKNENI